MKYRLKIKARKQRPNFIDNPCMEVSLREPITTSLQYREPLFVVDPNSYDIVGVIDDQFDGPRDPSYMYLNHQQVRRLRGYP